MTVRLSSLPEAGPLDGNELSLVVQSGISKKTTVGAINTFAASTLSGLVTQAESAATNAQVSATEASTAESGAELSAVNAAASAAAALASETAAGVSANNADSSANTSHDYYVDTFARWTDFDQRYLGAKTLDPTSDNMGQALIEGALYWNIPDNVMRVFGNSVWETAYIPSSGFLVASNNLSDLTNAATARSNLGLTIGTTSGTVAAGDHLHAGVYEPANANLLETSDIGVSVQAYNADTVVDASYVHTDNNYTAAEQTKLSGIAAGAEVNVNADWFAVSGDAQILNKPTLGTAAALDAGVANGVASLGADGLVPSAQLPPFVDAVLSVNGQTGTVVLGAGDVGAEPANANLLETSDIGVSVQAYDVDLTTWAGKTAPSGTVVGTTDTQTLTNKTVTVVAGYETRVAMGASDIDLAAGNYFTKTISGATTLTVSNTPASGVVGSFVLDLTDGGSATVTWWANVKWAGGTAPTLTTAGRDVLGFFTHDAGTTWSGFVLGADVK